MTDERLTRLNLQLDDEHATKLARVAERLYLQPGTAGRSLLYTILDQIDPDAVSIATILDGIPGAWEQAQRGAADSTAARVVDLADL